jgi:hypothetical protein
MGGVGGRVAVMADHRWLWPIGTWPVVTHGAVSMARKWELILRRDLGGKRKQIGASFSFNTVLLAAPSKK